MTIRDAFAFSVMVALIVSSTILLYLQIEPIITECETRTEKIMIGRVPMPAEVKLCK